MEEDEIDVEEVSIGDPASQLADTNQLPSAGTELSAELVQHPWMLEQGWCLDNCSDEKSRVAIEKMLQEEDFYLSGRRLSSANAEAASPKVKSGTSSLKPGHRSPRKFSEDEVQTVKMGIEIYGKRWTKIQAELLPHRTKQEVRACALKNFTMEVNTNDAKIDSTQLGEEGSAERLLTSASIQATRRRPRGRPRKTPIETNQSRPVSNLETAEIVKITSADSADSDTDVDIDIESEEEKEERERDHDPVYARLLATATATQDTASSLHIPIPTDHGSAEVEDEDASPSALLDQLEDLDHVPKETNTKTPVTSQPLDRRKFSHTDSGIENQQLDDDSGLNLCNTASPSQNKSGALGSSAVATGCQSIDTELTGEQTESLETDSALKEDAPTERTRHDTDSSDGQMEAEEFSHPNEYGIFNSSGDIVYLANPTMEVMVDEMLITDTEKSIHSEFFDGRPGMKNEDRYLRIRNHILHEWQRLKPSYMNKMLARHSLKNCGDVNCIGRIHSYLEQIGAINFGCAQAQYNRPSSVARPVVTIKRSQSSRVNADRFVSSRKRRVRDVDGQWVGEKELQGRTVEHRDKPERKSATKTARTSQDPFKLVPCQHFTHSHPAPFTVEVEGSALVTMDTHCHLAKTEVIGLLGGQYYREQGRVHISLAEPCDSVSTGMQCEMDPVSQTEASERIYKHGERVIGWYHSHPTFAPNPSVRDIATQCKFQDWFAQGGCPFLGIIISSYDRYHPSLCSDIRCLVVNGNTLGDTGMPYQFTYTVSQTRWQEAHLLDTVGQLAEKYANFPSRVELLHHYKSLDNVTCLDKMLTSLQSHMGHSNEGSSVEAADSLISRIREMFMNSIGATSSQQAIGTM